MSAAVAALRNVLAEGAARLAPYEAAHRDALAAACAEDRDIWDIYPHSMLDDRFDPAMAGRLAVPGVTFTVFDRAEIVGITAYLRPDAANAVVEIGGTYIVPRLRGTVLNRAMKRLMIDHAFACGFRRIELRVDERNGRSQAAVLKLGARREGLLRQDRVTWTGHVRNTCVFGLLREDWKR